MRALSDLIRAGFWRRVAAMTRKEFVQLRRDRITFATIVSIPLMQLVLFGYAINTQPRGLPTAVLLQESSDVGRSILKALENTKYFKITHQVRDETQFDRVLASGEVLFAIEIPRGFERALRRGDRPALLIAADATDPVATSTALAALNNIVTLALRNDRAIPDNGSPPFEIRTHARYNPAGSSQLNIVPGLMGTILTMTMIIMTALAVTRERERGTMENLLAMPVRPIEVMLGKIVPFIFVGYVQVAIILLAAKFLFQVPFEGSLVTLSIAAIVFIAANLAVGFTFSTLAENQLQAMQLSVFFFLPSLLLSGFMFPFRGMPDWAQIVGQALPLTHFLRIIRGVLLKGNGWMEIWPELWPIGAFMLVVSVLALLRYRKTLD